MRYVYISLLLFFVGFSCSQTKARIDLVSAPIYVAPVRKVAYAPKTKPAFVKPEAVSERKIRVMVIDTGVAQHYMIKPYLPDDVEAHIADYSIDTSRITATPESFMITNHGTHVAGVILFGDQNKNEEPACGEVELHSCKFYGTKIDVDNVSNTVSCFKKALALNVDYINYSAGGGISSPAERKILKELSVNGTKIIVAAGNESTSMDLKPYYPAQYFEDPEFENLIAVGNMDESGKKHDKSNYAGGIVFDYGMDIKSTQGLDGFSYMSGTSQAAAMYTHRLIMKRCKQIHKTVELENELPGQ